MTKVEDIGWGSYQEFEGPFYRGKVKFELPSSPTLVDKQLAAITAVESGHYDAINMYDRMIVTVGLIQWGEANTFSVSKMLGHLCESGLESVVQSHLKPALNASGASFKISKNNNWRFFIGDLEVNSVLLQQKLFLRCDGRKGSWTEQNKNHAKLWAACLASVFEDPKTREVQKRYTANRLLGFVMANARKSLFEDNASTDWAEATRAIYLTFAINLPRIAGEMFSSTKFVGNKWSKDWCLCLIKRLTFGPNIKIYPKRYDAIRPVIEKLFSIDLPKSSNDLMSWQPNVKDGNLNDHHENKPVIHQQTLVELNNIVMNQKPIEIKKQGSSNFITTFVDFLKKILLFALRNK